MAGKTGVYNDNARKYHVNENYFKNIDTSEKAYWLGFIQADGCLYMQKTSIRFQINLSARDMLHLEKLNRAIDSTYKVYEKKVTVKGREYDSCSLQITSKPFAANLMKNGIEIRKSLNDAFPSLSSNLMPHYIRGFMDGDGSIKVAKQKPGKDYVQVSVRFAGGKEFLIKLRDYLKKELNCSFAEKSIRRMGKSKAYEFSFSKQKDVINFYEHVYKDATVFLERKFLRYTKGLSSLYVPYKSNLISELSEFIESPNEKDEGNNEPSL